MINKEVFKKGLEDLQDCFSSFVINERKVGTWYKIVGKDLNDDDWQKMVWNCIVHCRKNTPSLADVIDDNEYYTKGDNGNKRY